MNETGAECSATNAERQRFQLLQKPSVQAAIRAGYSKKTAEWIGPQQLTKTHVAKAIAQGMKAHGERTAVTADRVLLYERGI